MARKTKEEAEKTRLQLLDSALAVFLEKGYSKTTLQDIASHAGVTRGAVYWHFKNKKEVYCAVMDSAFEPIEQYWEETFRASSDPLETVRSVLVEWFRMLAEDERMLQALELDLLKVEHGTELIDVLHELRCDDKEKIAEIASLIQQGIDKGQFRSELNATMVAVNLWSTVVGHAHAKLHFSDLLDWKKQGYQLADMFIRGISA